MVVKMAAMTVETTVAMWDSHSAESKVGSWVGQSVHYSVDLSAVTKAGRSALTKVEKWVAS